MPCDKYPFWYHRAVVVSYTENPENIRGSKIRFRVLSTQEVKEEIVFPLRLDYHSPECPDVPQDCGCTDDLNEFE